MGTAPRWVLGNTGRGAVQATGLEGNGDPNN